VTESALNLKAQVMVLNAVAQAAALLAALIHIAVSPLECFLIDRPAVQRFLRIQAKNISDIRLWAFAIGAHNLVVGLGTILGLVILHTGDEVVGKRSFWPVVCSCSSAGPSWPWPTCSASTLARETVSYQT
jgi:uncharacterized membrane protein